MCGGRLISRVIEEFQQPAMQTKKAAHWRIFSPNKSVPVNGKKCLNTNCLRKNEEIGCIFEFSRLRTLNSFKKFKIKIPVDV
jgi:hypothetical protein